MHPKHALLGAILAIAGTAHAENLLVNGSFELPSIAGYNYIFYPSGSTAMTGWTAFGAGDMQNTRTEFLAAGDGFQWVDLTGNIGYDKGLISDAVATEIGSTYRLSFLIGDYAPFGSSTVSVMINDGPARLFTNVYESGTMDWEQKSFDWIADAASVRISFTGVANGALSNNLGIGLDGVVLEKVTVAVPEPETYALMLAGLGLVGAIARRRRV